MSFELIQKQSIYYSRCRQLANSEAHRSRHTRVNLAMMPYQKTNGY